MSRQEVSIYRLFFNFFRCLQAFNEEYLSLLVRFISRYFLKLLCNGIFFLQLLTQFNIWYKKTQLILHLVILFKVFIKYTSFLMELLDSLKYIGSGHLQIDRDNLISSFLICIGFIFSSLTGLN